MYNCAQATMTHIRAKPLNVVALLLMAACGHNAWLGMQCPSADMRCEDAGPAAHSGAPDAGASAEPTVPDSGAASAQVDAGHPSVPDASVMQDAALPSECRSVSMNYFACAGGAETAGAPQLQAGHSYTLRFLSAYKIDTTFLLQGSTNACTAVMLGTLTVHAGEPSVERCLMPTEDIALLVTVMSGDVQVWMQNGLMAELCEGCS